jgi:putative phosphoribosyl transferase
MHTPHPTPPLFAGPEDAGARLSAALDHERRPDAVTLGVAPHGMPAAAEVAERLGLDLDLVVVEPIVIASLPGCVLGAVAPEGPPVLRPGPEVCIGDLVAAAADAADHADALDRRLHRSVPRLDVEGRACIVVDEILGAPEPMLAAVRWLRARHPGRIAVAVPAGSRQAVERVRTEVDALVCLHELASFWPSETWYRRTGHPPEAAVVRLLERARGIPADVLAPR